MLSNYEKKVVNDILSFIMNLEDKEEAETFFRLYMKSINASIGNFIPEQVDENKIREYIGAIDSRFRKEEDNC